MAMRLGDGADAVGIEEAAGIVAAIVGGVTRAGAGGSGGRWRGVQVVAAGEDGRERGWRRWRRSGTGWGGFGSFLFHRSHAVERTDGTKPDVAPRKVLLLFFLVVGDFAV